MLVLFKGLMLLIVNFIMYDGFDFLCICLKILIFKFLSKYLNLVDLI